MARLFFALWPNDATRARLAAALAALPPLGGRAVPVRNLHLTLVFAGSVGTEQQRALADGAAAIRAATFTFALERLGCYPRAGVAWLAPAETPAAMHALVDQLRTLCRAAGIAPETRAFEAHVTIARKVRAAPAAIPTPVPWIAREFCLVESITAPAGSEYRVAARWPLISRGSMG